MFNLHCHSFLSDGVLLPSEVAVRYFCLGYKTIAITDHADYSNIDFIIKSILQLAMHWPKAGLIKILPGIELTHLPPEQFIPLAKYARSKGIKIIVAHGQTQAEPVIAGTNKAALKADIDILAHPGLISDEDCLLAKANNVFLEITSRHGHGSTNAHVAKKAKKFGAKLIINTDSHAPEDIISKDELIKVALKAGLSHKDVTKIYHDVNVLLKNKEAR